MSSSNIFERHGGNSKKSKKAKTSKKSGLNNVSKSKSDRGAAADSHADDDSMVAPGGPAIDDDAGEVVERPKTGKNAKGLPAVSAHIGSDRIG